MNSSNKTGYRHHCELTLLSDIVVNMLSALSMFGALLNFIGALVCLQIIVKKYEHKANGHIFKFLFIKSIDDFVLFASQTFSFTFYCTECINNHSRANVIWSIYFEHYIESIFEFCSAYMQVLVTLDCLFTIRNICQLTKSKWYPYALIGTFHLYAVIFYIFWPFSFEMVQINGEQFDIETNQFYRTTVSKVFRILSPIQKNLLPLLSMLCLIPLMLKLLNDIYRNKHRLNVRVNQVFVVSGITASTTISKKIKKKFILLIVMVGILDVIGRTPEVVFYSIDSSTEFWVCFNEVSKFIYFFSCLGDIFLYYLLNKKFKNAVKENLKKIGFLRNLFQKQQTAASVTKNSSLKSLELERSSLSNF